jgi:hypothetical protein
VDTWVKQGLLPPPRLIGGKRLWKWKTVESYLEGTHNEAQTPERQAEDITNATRAASGRAGDASAGVGRHTAAGLVQTRSDVGCAAITSGVVALAAMQRDLGHPIPAKHPLYDPVDHVWRMKQRPRLRLFVVGDPKDKRVSYRSQLQFVERVRAHGLPIVHVRAAAPADDEWSHNLHPQGIRLAADCAHGLDDQTLVAKVPGQADPTRGEVPLIRTRIDSKRSVLCVH